MKQIHTISFSTDQQSDEADCYYSSSVYCKFQDLKKTFKPLQVIKYLSPSSSINKYTKHRWCHCIYN